MLRKMLHANCCFLVKLLKFHSWAKHCILIKGSETIESEIVLTICSHRFDGSRKKRYSRKYIAGYGGNGGSSEDSLVVKNILEKYL